MYQCVCICVLEGVGSDLYLVSGDSDYDLLRPLTSSKSETWGAMSTLREKKPIREISLSSLAVSGNKFFIYCLVKKANYHPPLLYDMIVCSYMPK